MMISKGVLIVMLKVRCPKKRIMISRDNGEIESNDKNDTRSMPPLEDMDNKGYAAQGEL